MMTLKLATLADIQGNYPHAAKFMKIICEEFPIAEHCTLHVDEDKYLQVTLFHAETMCEIAEIWIDREDGETMGAHAPGRIWVVNDWGRIIEMDK